MAKKKTSTKTTSRATTTKSKESRRESVIPRWGGGAQSSGGRRYVGLGWQPDPPDPRDWGWEQMQAHLKTALPGNQAQRETTARKVAPHLSSSRAALPTAVDHRSSGWLPPVEDQESIGSCTAHAVVGMAESLIRRLGGAHIDLSRLFLYKTTRNLLGWPGDTGAYIRSTIKALRIFGAPPERDWPYLVGQYEEEPSAYHYAYAKEYQALSFARLDSYNSDGARALRLLKAAIASNLTVSFGFPVFSSISDPTVPTGHVPYPRQHDQMLGGHAVLAVGYDDSLAIESRGGKAKTGAVIFRNSWSHEWGDSGYGYIPYAYFEDALAIDLWTLFNTEWFMMSALSDRTSPPPLLCSSTEGTTEWTQI